MTLRSNPRLRGREFGIISDAMMLSDIFDFCTLALSAPVFVTAVGALGMLNASASLRSIIQNIVTEKIKKGDSFRVLEVRSSSEASNS